MRNDKTKIIAIVVSVALLLFIGADFWTGKAITVSGVVETTDIHINTNHNNDGYTRTSVNYSALVSTNQNMGIPVTVSITNGQYKILKYGDEVKVEISRGGITGITHYTKLR